MLNNRLFKDRKDAGEQLALSLEKYKNKNVLVLGIPRGGVEIAYYVAKYLNAELSLIISKKIPHPFHPEYGIGAISEGNIVYIPPYISVNVEVLYPLIEELKEEIHRRVMIYRAGKPLPEIKDRVVIIVDDGIATGVTFIPAIRLCHKLKASKVIIAAPVSGKEPNKDLNEADEHYILHQPEQFYGVGLTYENFPQLTDEDVLLYLSKAKAFNNAIK
jgi:putative phosphoribosyl transferase